MSQSQTNVKEGLKRQVNLTVTVIALVLALLFPFLKLKGIELGGFISSLPASLVLDTAICLYFLSWCRGLPWDTSTQLSIYVNAPHKGTLFSPTSTFLIVSVVVTFGLMAWAQSTLAFGVLLLAFLVVDMGGRCYILWSIMPEVEKSDQHYRTRSEYTKLETLKATAAYMAGKWNLARYAVGVALIVLLGILMFVPSVIGRLQGLLGGVSRDFIIASTMLLYVLVLEGWQWYKRLELWDYGYMLEEMNGKYTLTPKPPAPTVAVPVPEPESPVVKVSVS